MPQYRTHIEPGTMFGKWVVVARVSREGRSRFFCLCECGNGAIIQPFALVSKRTTECSSCRKKAARGYRHGDATGGRVTTEYRTWTGMMARCFNSKDASFARYGGRGITVYPPWRTFANFIKDVGRKPSPAHSLDRFPNNNGNYEPGNVRWATILEQQRNRSTNRLVALGEMVFCVSEWSEITGLPSNTILHRLDRGWSVAKSMGTPIREMKNNVRARLNG